MKHRTAALAAVQAFGWLLLAGTVLSLWAVLR